MALSHLSRRLLSPTASAAMHLPRPCSYGRDPFILINPGRRFFATSTDPSPNGSSTAPSDPGPVPPSGQQSLESMQHQEIEGPTVERDTSPLADETRRELDALRRAVHRLSGSLALLGGAHLVAGSWIAYGAPPVGVESAAVVQGVVAFAFPFTAALVLRRAIKPIAFFQKMEANARLQVLTLCLQATKNVNLMLLRTRVVAIACALGVSVGSVAVILMR
ncbi:hypothetical protein PR202_ga02527 [Eleusine coracana subsp. coracana]|uniref:Uncharacterized protein n=1 Tax=Eleusine coracana subsp. coracana TaxID=191504 RepID=A0AAV5BLT7_ELECO|nr:hypothetical protein QOZ80_2AG0143460 [Eleusine coracana subsp. coracana]GJM86650.1 hypothetical protein PR202_ga02527 [Eleusine coracana subsp. coracana]